MSGLLRRVIAGVITLSAAVLHSACASPIEGLWPPPPESVQHTVSVSIDTWHAMIAFPIEPSATTPQLSATGEEEQNGTTFSPRYQPSDIRHSLFEEWGYAERAWYLEGKTGVTGILRALFWPTEGVVEVGHYDRVWAERTPQPPSDLFSFHLTEEGYQRLRRHLHTSLLNDEPVASFRQSVFYPAKRSYHLFHTCHQYAAHALREAGIPLSPFWAFNRTSLAWQLRRAARIHEEQPTEVPAIEAR